MRAAKRPIEEISREAIPDIEVEDFSESFEGFILECSSIKETVILPTFRLVDETSSVQTSSSSQKNAEVSQDGDASEVNWCSWWHRP